MKIEKAIYWIATLIMCFIFLFSSGMYLTNYTMVKGFFEHLGFPIWLIYPLAILKIAAVIAILTRKSTFLKELAYAGLLFDAILALSAHSMAKDGGYFMSFVALVAIIVSWVFDRKVVKP